MSSVALSLPGGCEVFDPPRLEESGSVAVWLRGGVQVVTDRDLSGHRLWHGGVPEPIRLARSAVADQ
ncbi:MAG: hypothetical protein KI788_21705 [Mameliella sp.]|nr:hypothetical protein [Mameliella sp.]